MKKLILASFGVLLASLSFGQTFTVNVGTLSTTWPNDENGGVLACPQPTTAMKSNGTLQTSGTLIEAIAQANLGKIKKIIFAPNVSTINLGSRWQTSNFLCANDVSIIADHQVEIIGNSTVGAYATILITGQRDTIQGLKFTNAFLQLNGKYSYISKNTFNTSIAYGCIYMYNTSYNTIINNNFTSTFSSTWQQLSAIRIGSHPSGNPQGNALANKILYNTAQGFTGNGIQAGEWKQTTPVCDSLLIRGNDFNNNKNAGIYVINSTGSLIDSNFVYSNQGGGIFVEDCKYVKVFANSVGVDKLGNVLGNKGNGININGGNNIRVGDFIKGPNLVVASGNSTFAKGSNNGISFDQSPLTTILPINSSIKSNFVGVLPDGSGSKNTTGTQQSGIYFGELSNNLTVLNDTVGGILSNDGNLVGFSGLIGGSGSSGIQINQNCNTVLVYNNYAGITKTGLSIPNTVDGIAVRGGINCDVYGNKVGNNLQGIAFRFSNDGSVYTTQSKIRGNYCGTSNLKDKQGNTDHGISVEWGSNNNIVGGTTSIDTNFIMNEVDGIWIAGNSPGSSNPSNQNKLLGNKILNCQKGILVTNKTRNLLIKNNYLKNNLVGISFNDAADSPNLQSNTIDSSTSNAVVIDAVVLNYKSQNNKIQRTTAGNGVYVNKAIKTAEFRTDTVSENSANGYLFNTGTQSIIGGTNGEGNVIYKNGSAGIRLSAAAANEIQMRRNSISCNTVAGIKLEGNANAEFSAISDQILIDTSATTKDTIVGVVNINSPYANGIIEAFDKGPECKQTCFDEKGRQGYKYIGQAVTGVDGKFRLGLSSPITDFKNITFTVTTKGASNTTGKFSTSEFSRCTNILPVSFLKVSASSVAQGVLVKWTTASETNNEYFVVQRSKDGIHFETISGEIQGAGNSFTATNYSFVDTKPNEGINYYKIKQVDFNGTSDYSKIVAVNLGSDKVILIAPNPSKGEFTIKVIGDDETAYRVNVFNALGQLIFDSNLDMFTGYAEKKFDISNYATGVYTVHLISETKSWTKKLIKE